jgi:hypothetical protein
MACLIVTPARLFSSLLFSNQLSHFLLNGAMVSSGNDDVIAPVA